MRIACGVIAALVFATLALRLNLTATEHDTSILGAAWRSFRFFTVWTNTLIGGVCLWIAFGGRTAHWITAGLAMSIALVAVVYHALLAASQSYEGLEILVDFMFHTAIPLLFIALWLALMPKSDLHWRDLIYWMAYPVIYCAYALGRAAVDGTYPYFFLNLDTLGPGGVALWVMGLAAVFAAFGTLVIAAARVRNRASHTA